MICNCNVEELDAVMTDTHRRRAISKTTDSRAVVRDAFVQIFNSKAQFVGMAETLEES